MDEKAQSQVFHDDRFRRLQEAKRAEKELPYESGQFLQRGTHEEWRRLDFTEKSHKIRLTQRTEGDEEQIKMLPHLVSQ